MNLSFISLTSFNDSITNDCLSYISELIPGILSILYLIFISKCFSYYKLNNFEYFIILLTSILGFFLLFSVLIFFRFSGCSNVWQRVLSPFFLPRTFPREFGFFLFAFNHSLELAGIPALFPSSSFPFSISCHRQLSRPLKLSVSTNFCRS